MQRTLHARIPLLAILGAALILTNANSFARAHETHPVGAYRLSVGWAQEPALAGIINAVELEIDDAAGKPVTRLGDELKVEVIFGDRKLGPLSFEPAGDGAYRAPFIPTRPGNYTFHLMGSVVGQSIDQSFSPTDKQGLEPVEEPGEVEFPARDPSRGELASRLDRLTPRLKAFQSTARADSRAAGDRAGRAAGLGIAGIIIGTLALALGVAGALRSRVRVAGAPASRKETHA